MFVFNCSSFIPFIPQNVSAILSLMFCTTFHQRRLYSQQFIFTGKSNGSFCFYEQNHSIDVDLPKAFYSPSRPQPNIFAWRHSRVFGMRCGEVWWSTVLWGVVVYMRCVVYCEVWWSIVVSVPAPSTVDPPVPGLNLCLLPPHSGDCGAADRPGNTVQLQKY